MSYGSDFGSPSNSSPESHMDKDLERFIDEENQKQRMQHLVSELNDKCWDLCVEKPGQRLDSRTETCLANCVNRFIDTTNFIVQRLEKFGAQHASSSELEFN